MNKYIRYGEIPPNEKSVDFMKLSFAQNEDFTWDLQMMDAVDAYWRLERECGSDVFENGVSVFEIVENGEALTNNDALKTSLDHRQNKSEISIYIVTGDEIGRGRDGEPLIKNIKILEKIR